MNASGWVLVLCAAALAGLPWLLLLLNRLIPGLLDDRTDTPSHGAPPVSVPTPKEMP